jgi:predicted PurR-regulated permease PerM
LGFVRLDVLDHVQTMENCLKLVLILRGNRWCNLLAHSIKDSCHRILARRFAEGIIGFFIVLVVAIYFLADGERGYKWLLAFLPEAQRKKMTRAGEEIRRQGRTWRIHGREC